MEEGIIERNELRRIKKRKRIALLIFLLLVAGFYLLLGGRHDTSLTEAEGKAITDICAVDIEKFTDRSAEALTREARARFPAASKVYQSGDLYAFIIKPVGYNGHITLAVVIDGASDRSVGIRIVSHTETPHYVRDMEKDWFIKRFADKPVGEYLNLVRLKAQNERDIVAITGATVTTDGIINGVNAAFGVYREFVLGENIEGVPDKVIMDPGYGNEPVETKSLAIRAYGVVIAEVSLDDIKALPSVKRTMSIHSSKGTTTHEFRGTLLSNILELAGRELMSEYDWILAVGVDDYISDIGMDEVAAENSVFVMYEDNGEPLYTKRGKPGGMRIVVLDDVFGQRFTNYLLEIVLEREE